MSIIYGASVIRNNVAEVDINYDAIGKNSEAFTIGDPVTIASGQLRRAGNSETIVGYATKTVTMTADNVTVAKVTPGYVPVSEGALYLMGSNTDLTGNATNPGNYCALTGNTTGAVQIDGSNLARTTVDRVVEIVQVDPFNEGGTGAGSGLRVAVVRIVKTPYTNVAITA